MTKLQPKTRPEQLTVPWEWILPEKKMEDESKLYEIDFFIAKDSDKNTKITTMCGNDLDFTTNQVTIIENQIFCKVDAFDYESVRDGTSKAVQEITQRGITQVAVKESDCFANWKDAVADGLILTQFKYDVLKKERKDQKYVYLMNHSYFRPYAQNIGRFLTCTPPNMMTPTRFCDFAKKIIEKLNLPVNMEVYDEETCAKMGMNLYLSVGQGSVEENKFLVLSYRGNDMEMSENFKSYDISEKESEKPTVEVLDKSEYDLILVGKGITFDSGGLSLKPPKSQPDMKGDMMGAATVFSVLVAAAKEKLKMNLKVLIPLSENLPSGSATKPSDVFVAKNGLSVEINNTDAEGRLVLADALCCAQDFKGNRIISVATLTGAVIVALGSVLYGVFSTDDEFYQEIEDAGKSVADKGWRLPLDKKYKKLLESDVADLSNVAYSAGSVTAAVFLQQFVQEREYAHLDIAGMLETKDAWGKKFGCRPTGMLFALCQKIATEKK